MTCKIEPVFFMHGTKVVKMFHYVATLGCNYFAKLKVVNT